MPANLGRITYRTRPVALNLRLQVQTACLLHTITFVDGQSALRAVAKWDRDPFTVWVRLVNLVAVGNEVVPTPSPVRQEDGSVKLVMVDELRTAYQEVLVWESIDTMPRWVTAPAREKARQHGEAFNGSMDKRSSTEQARSP